MRQLDTIRHARRGRLAVALLLTLALTLASAGSAYGEQSVLAKRNAAIRKMAIQKILDTNADNPDGVMDPIKKIFGEAQGNDAVVRTRQILDALPSDISDAQWGAIKAVLNEKAGQMISARASQLIVEKLAKKESELGKTQLLAIADSDESVDEVEAGRKSSSPIAPPPQTEVVCVSQNC